MQESDLKIEELVDEAVYSASASASLSADPGVLDNSDPELLIDEEDELDAQTLMDRKHMELAIQMAKSKSVQLSGVESLLYTNMRIPKFMFSHTLYLLSPLVPTMRLVTGPVHLPSPNHPPAL